MYIKSNVPCIVIGIMRVVKPIQGVVPDLAELIIKDNEKENMHIEAERWFLCLLILTLGIFSIDF